MRIQRVNPELWYDIPGYEGKYQINYFGQLRRALKTGKYKMLHPYVKKSNGRRVVKLNCKEQKVSKLMQKTFIGKLPEGYMTYHKNGLKYDDCLSNIGVATKSEIGKKTGHLNESADTVVKINADGEIVDCYKSIREAGRRNHMSYQTISDRINGKVKGLYAPDGHVYVRDKDSDIQKAIRRIELQNRKECGVSFIPAPKVAFDF